MTSFLVSCMSRRVFTKWMCSIVWFLVHHKPRQLRQGAVIKSITVLLLRRCAVSKAAGDGYK